MNPQPDTNTQLVASQEQDSRRAQSGAVTKRGLGRPLLEELAKIQEERKVTHEAKSEKKKHEGSQMIINFGEEGRCGILATHFHHKSLRAVVAKNRAGKKVTLSDHQVS